jgi:alkaline phosphatase D
MRRRDFLYHSAIALPAFALPWDAQAAAEARQATGVKLGEVTHDSAIAWMRLTANASRRRDGVIRRGTPRPLPGDLRVIDMEGAAPGAPGRVRLVYSTREDLRGAIQLPWADVQQANDFAHQVPLTGLRPDTAYFYSAETGASGASHGVLRGQFRTAPSPDDTTGVSFVVTTCQKYSQLDHEDGFHIYDSMLKQSPRFFVSAGDIVYYDSDDPRATTPELARYHWNRMFSFPRHVRMMLNIPGYWEKDDHDTLSDDTWDTQDPEAMRPMTFAQGLRIFREQVPMSERTYRTFRWGKTLQIWVVEGRDYRSPNTMADGPGKTIWGGEQKAWLKKTLLASDADWKVLVSPTPIVGPDRPNKRDNHSNASFAHEGREFREWVKANLSGSFFNINGDRHWQYHSVHPETGLHEYSAGAASDSHAGGTPGENPNFHRFHRVKGGFLSVATWRDGKQTFIRFRHHDVMGSVGYEQVVSRPRAV